MPNSTPTANPVLRIRGVSKRFGEVDANRDIDLTLQRGEVLALLGENGAGKTTLMSILFGHYVADRGRIEVNGLPLPPGSPAAAIAAGIGMVHQHFTLADNLSVLDNVILGTESLWSPFQNRRRARDKLDELSARFGLSIDPNAQVADLSVGERQRVELLKVLYRDARILILDEPTAVLTPQETDTLFHTLEDMVSEGLSIIFISHKLNEVLSISRRIAVLRHGTVVGEFERADTSRAALAAAMVGRAVATPSRTEMSAGTPVLELRSVDVHHGKSRLEGVSLTVREHEVIGIAGVSGNGQSALADLVSGLCVPESGDLVVLGAETRRGSPSNMVAAGVGRIPEDRHGAGLVGEMTVSENLVLESYRQPHFSRFGWLRAGIVLDHAHELLERYDVRCAGPGAATRSLSGGNMQKLILARALSQRPKLVLACQPTRGLDIGAAAYVHRQILEARGRGSGILLISEDLDELLTLSDRIMVIFRGRLSPAITTEEADRAQLGLLMSGQGFTRETVGDPRAA
jgi:simple sugar transport system ATP-binding protein